MKTIVLIVGLCCLGLTVAQTNCPGPDYSPIVRLIASLNATIRPVKSVGYPDQLSLNNSRYANYWMWNMIGQNYADVIANASTYLIQAYANFSAAANNTKGDWSSVVANITQALSMINSGGSMPMRYASDMFMNISQNITMIFTNLQNIFQSYSTLLPPLNINATPANIMKFIPSPQVMGALLAQIVNVTNQYIGLVNSTSRDVNNTYTLFKQADPYFLAIETQLNGTIRNMSIANNVTSLFINQTITNLTRSANSVYNTFMNSLPTTLKTSSAWQNDWAGANSTRDMFNTSLSQMIDELNSYLNMYLMSNQMALNQFYDNGIMMQLTPIRTYLFSYFMNNVSFNTCYSRFFNQSTVFYNGSGAAPALFNCTNIESAALTEVQTILSTYLNTISIDVNATLAYLQRCTNLTNTPILTDNNANMGYSMQQCLETNGAAILQSFSIDSVAQQIKSLINTELMFSSQRLQTCLSDNGNQLLSAYYPAYVGYQNCTMALLSV